MPGVTPALTVPGLTRPLLALIVDRDDDTRHMYAQFLRLARCEIDEAVDGREGLAKAISRHPDVIVSETRLPFIDGIEMCRLLHTDPITRDIPVLFVTADAFTADIARATDAGAHTVLVKPCLPGQLAEAIRAALDRPRVSEATVRETPANARRAASKNRSRARAREDTVSPPLPVPALDCPQCGRRLRYVRSHVGGVSALQREQWDYFECDHECGTFQYRQRTRKIRRVA